MRHGARMTPETVIFIGKEALIMAATIGAIPLLSALAIGLVIGMLQAATQINEMTLSFIPKLLVLVVALSVGGPWMLSRLVDYTRHLIERIPVLIG